MAPFLWLITLAASATSSPAKPLPPSEARSAVQRQLAVPPRHGPAAGLSAPEADAVMARYLASIGKLLDKAPQEPHQ